MFPIRDHNPSERTPYVVYTLMALNIALFLATLSAGSEQAQFRIYLDWGIIPARVSSGAELHTLFTSMFLHGGFWHLAGNMLFLWIFGDNLEDEMGHVGFSLFYVVAGLGAGLIHVISAPYSNVPTIGASGAIAGIMGGYLLLFPKAKVDILVIFIVFFKIFPIPAWVMLGVWLTFQFIGGASADPDTGGVAYWAHSGGFFVGLILAVPVWLRRGGTGYWSRTHGHPPHPETEYSTSRIPRVKRR